MKLFRRENELYVKFDAMESGFHFVGEMSDLSIQLLFAIPQIHVFSLNEYGILMKFFIFEACDST